MTSGGNSILLAGNDLAIKGSDVAADKGGVVLAAGNDVQIIAATDSTSARHEKISSKSSWGGFKSSKVEDQLNETQTEAVGSMVSGDTVSVTAGRDVAVKGSSLVSTADMKVQAGRDLTIDAAENTFTRKELHKEKSRDLTGVLTGNKLGLDDMTGNQHLSIGAQKHNGNAQETTLTGSTIGSSEGNVELIAGRELKVVASDLISTRDMSLSGANVTIAAGTETARQTTEDSSKSLAVGRVVGGMVVDTAKSIRNDVRAAQQADDSRLKAVKGAQALLSAYNAVGSMDGGAAKESEGQPANSSGSLIKIGTELASTRNKSISEYYAETVKQSTLNSGGSLVIIATGTAPDTKGDIHVIGSSIKARDTLLLAKNDITLESAQDRKNWDNQNKNDKTSIGASFNIGDQNGFTLDLGAQIAKGMGTGHEVTQVNSTIDTGLLVLKSGQDTTLAGAQLRAETIKADIGGNLNIASRQDEASQQNRQTSGGVGASICVPPFCFGSMVTASGNIGGNKMDSDYKAVTEQTGLFAGSGGYDIHVGKNTTLQGALIASEASADKNRLSSERLLVSDIRNKSDIESQAGSLSYSGTSEGQNAARSDIGGTMPLLLQESNSSKTRSAVSDGTIVIRDAAGADDLVGLNRDTTNTNQQLDRPDQKAMQERIDLIQSSAQLSSGIIATVAKAKAESADKQLREAKTDAQKAAANVAMADAKSWQVGGDKKLMADIASGLIAAGLGGAGGSTAVGIVANTSSSDIFNKIGDFADAQKNRKDIDSATKAAWGEGGAARVLLHALAGAAIGLSSGSVQSGALGAGASAALMPAIADALGKNGIVGADQDALATLIATGVGTVAGAGRGVDGSVVAGGNAVSVDVYNRQIHDIEVAAIDAEAAKGELKKENLEKAVCFTIKCWAQLDRGTKEYHDAYLSEADMVGLSNELEWADAQRDKGLFNYSFTDGVLDFGTRDLIPLGGSAAAVVGGGIGIASGTTLCGTMVGCVFGGPMATFGAGNMVEGSTGAWNHFNNDKGSYNPVKKVFSYIPGGYGPVIYSGADLALSFGAGFVKVPLKMGLADGLNRPKSIFGVTVRGVDNNFFVPIVGTPTPYGTAMTMYFKSLGDKGVTFYQEVSNEKK